LWAFAANVKENGISFAAPKSGVDVVALRPFRRRKTYKKRKEKINVG